MRLDGSQPFRHPMADPGQALSLRQMELALKEFADPRHDERMRVAGNDLRQPADPGAPAWILR
jgi:hypothetical protein